MKYFTFDWAMGKVEDDQLIDRYNRFLTTLPSQSVVRFATTIGLNDAYVDRVIYDSRSRELKLLLLTGDLQVGYWRTELSYAGALIGNESILRHALAQRPTEIWYDEFTQDAGRLTHGFLLAPRDLRGAKAQEFQIEFDAFDYSQILAEERELKTPTDVSEWQ
jgi:hypothetical protein